MTEPKRKLKISIFQKSKNLWVKCAWTLGSCRAVTGDQKQTRASQMFPTCKKLLSWSLPLKEHIPKSTFGLMIVDQSKEINQNLKIICSTENKLILTTNYPSASVFSFTSVAANLVLRRCNKKGALNLFFSQLFAMPHYHSCPSEGSHQKQQTNFVIWS